MPYKEDQQLRQLIIRVAKSDSSFIYFILESNEGISFYSTLSESLNEQYRDIVIYSTLEFVSDLDRTLKVLEDRFQIEYLKESTISDSL